MTGPPNRVTLYKVDPCDLAVTIRSLVPPASRFAIACYFLAFPFLCDIMAETQRMPSELFASMRPSPSTHCCATGSLSPSRTANAENMHRLIAQTP